MEVQVLSEDMERSVDGIWEFKVKGWGDGEEGEEDMGGEGVEGGELGEEGEEGMGEREEKMGGEGEWRAPMAGEVLREMVKGLVRKWEEMVGGVEGLV